MIDHRDVDIARQRMTALVRRTPVLEAGGGETDGTVAFKLEFMQHTGSFKVRGAFNRVLSAQERGELDPDVGLVVASGGNAGLGNAYAAARLGVPAVVFVPETSPPVKVARLEEYGAKVIAVGQEYATALAAAEEHAARTGALQCHAYDQPEIAAGAGTLALELLEQTAEPVDTVLVAVGGGGLMAGIAAATEPRGVRVVAVEPAAAATCASHSTSDDRPTFPSPESPPTHWERDAPATSRSPWPAAPGCAACWSMTPRSWPLGRCCGRDSASSWSMAAPPRTRR